MALEKAYELHMKNICNCHSFWKVWIFSQFRGKVLAKRSWNIFSFLPSSVPSHGTLV